VGYFPAGNILRFSPTLMAAKDDMANLPEWIDHLLEIVG
jgi:hypothetical protein